MDRTTTAIIIILIVGAIFVLVKVINALFTAAESRKKAGKNTFWISVPLMLLLILPKVVKVYNTTFNKSRSAQTQHIEKKQQIEQFIHETTATDSDYSEDDDENDDLDYSDDSNDVFYFINFIDTPPFDNTVTLDVAKCSLQETEYESCLVKCTTTQISNDLYNLGTVSKDVCDIGTNRLKMDDGSLISDVYYDSPLCVEHVTRYKYDIKSTTTNFETQSCEDLKHDQEFLSGSMDEDDFKEITKPVLRDFVEFERLYQKYYGE